MSGGLRSIHWRSTPYRYQAPRSLLRFGTMATSREASGRPALGSRLRRRAEVTVQQTAVGDKPFESVELVARSQGLPPVRRRVWLHHTERPLDGITLRGSGDVRMRIARDGTGARIFRQDQLVAILSPLVAWPAGISPIQLDLVESTSSKAVFQGPQIRSLTIEAEDDVWRYRLDASEPREGPVLRVLGELQQGLLPGVEYLGRGERSSSTLDIRTPEHIRFAPDPMDVTMPLDGTGDGRGERRSPLVRHGLATDLCDTELFRLHARPSVGTPREAHGGHDSHHARMGRRPATRRDHPLDCPPPGAAALAKTAPILGSTEATRHGRARRPPERCRRLGTLCAGPLASQLVCGSRIDALPIDWQAT